MVLETTVELWYTQSECYNEEQEWELPSMDIPKTHTFLQKMQSAGYLITPSQVTLHLDDGSGIYQKTPLQSVAKKENEYITKIVYSSLEFDFSMNTFREKGGAHWFNGINLYMRLSAHSRQEVARRRELILEGFKSAYGVEHGNLDYENPAIRQQGIEKRRMVF